MAIQIKEIPQEVKHLLAEIKDHLEDGSHHGYLLPKSIEAIIEFYAKHHPKPCIIETDPKGVITHVDAEFAKLAGYEPQELIGTEANILRSPNTPTGIFQQMWQKITQGEPWMGELENVRKDFSPFWIAMLIIPVVDIQGNPMKYLGIAFDLTEEYEQRRRLEEKNKELVDSLKYAKRIQKIFLPPNELLDEILDDYFVIYRPRDVVSGDFYWAAKTVDKAFVAVVDCTGHGVPGAFMSLIGHNLLNQIVLNKKIYDPGEILTELHKEVRATLKQDRQQRNKDGMDLAFITIERYGDKVYYAGANNHIYWWSTEKDDLIVVRADKMPIGGEQLEEERVFTTKTLEIQEGDCLYLFTDGFVDQFGGPEDKRFGSKRLKNLIRKYHNESMRIQRAKFNLEWKEWRGDGEQIDDVTMIGIRFGEID